MNKISDDQAERIALATRNLARQLLREDRDMTAPEVLAVMHAEVIGAMAMLFGGAAAAESARRAAGIIECLPIFGDCLRERNLLAMPCEGEA
jgi:hypothetical protein